MIQHNVLDWKKHKYDLLNTYKLEDPDIILLNSTNMKNNERIKIFGYNIYQMNISEINGDGIAVAIKIGIKHQRKYNLTENFITLEIDDEHQKYCISTTYLPPKRPEFPWEDFIKLSNLDTPSYIIGDFNASHPVMGHTFSNHKGTQISRLISLKKLNFLGPNFQTYYGGGGVGKPDLMLGNKHCYHNYHLEAGTPTSSDHIHLIIKLSTSPIQVKIQERYAPKKTDWQKYEAKCLEYEFNNFNQKNKDDINNEFKKIVNFISNAKKECTPKIKTRNLPHNKFSHEIIKTKKELDKIYKLINNGWARNEDRRKYVQLRRNLREQMKAESIKVWEEVIKKTDTKNIQDFWKDINRMRGCCKIKPQKNIKNNNIELIENNEIEKAFREKLMKQFNISDEENKKFCKDTEKNVTDFLKNNLFKNINHTADITQLPNTGIGRKITADEIIKIINKMKEKAAGESGITKQYLKNLPHYFIEHIAHLFNCTISIGTFPEVFKHANIIMIPKKENPTDINDFRPISLLDQLGKVLEKIMNNRLTEHLENNNCLHKFQFGFRKKRGTETALALGTEHISQARAEGKQVSIVLRDIKSAFDKVWIAGLQYKIINLNLEQNFTNILCDFLINRKCRLSIKNFKGDIFNMGSGVPQGSSLSPTLYNLYVADYPLATSRSIDIVYADDLTQIVISENYFTEEQHVNIITRHIKRINEYEKKWKIQTNQLKFNIITLGKRNPLPIRVNNMDIRPITSGKFLGLHISKYGYSKHINHRKGLAEIALNSILKFSALSPETKRKLYLTIVRSTLTYPIVPLNSIKKTNMIKIQRIQNRATRWITNYSRLDRKTSKFLHEKSNLIPINEFLNIQADKTFERLLITNPEDTQKLINKAANIYENHRGFPSALKSIGNGITPLYK